MSKFLEDAAEFAKQSGGTMYNISEIHHGKLDSVTLTRANPCQNGYSVAKAFTMTAIGMLCDDGILSTDEKITDIFADKLPNDIDSRWYNMTVHHVLKHRCGFPGGFLDIDCIDANMFGNDYLKTVFNVNLQYNPGEGYSYSDGAYYLLSRVVSRKTGRILDEFLWERLFYPLEFREVAWSKCPKGYAMGATGLYTYTEDTVKLAEVYLRGGVYNGKRIVSEEWVNKVKTCEYEFASSFDGKCYGKGGMRGQMLMFLPEQDRALAWHSYDGANLTEWAVNYKD